MNPNSQEVRSPLEILGVGALNVSEVALGQAYSTQANRAQVAYQSGALTGGALHAATSALQRALAAAKDELRARGHEYYLGNP